MIILPVMAILFVYFLAKKPDIIGIALFTSIIADVNFNLPGMPLNFRSMMSICLLIRIMTSKPKREVPPFIKEGYTMVILFFLIYSIATTANKGLFKFDLVKEAILNFIAAYLAFYYYFQDKTSKILKWGMILGGLVCVADLAYTYAFIGDFPVMRVYYLFTPAFGVLNHNFYGMVCAAVFVYLLADYLSSKKGDKLNLLMMPPMFLGVLLSTSRSALLIVAIVALWLIVKGMFSANKGKRAYTLVMVTVGCLLLTLFIFQIIQSVFHVNSEFLESITGRLIDEPMAMINRALGNSYNVNQLDSMDWRIEATQIASNTFDRLPMDEKLFGIGIDGFTTRNYGFGYDAHNGPLLMMIEFGVVGAFVYFAMIFWMLYRAWKLKLQSAVVAVIVFMLLFITSHNKELVYTFFYLLSGSLAAQLHYKEFAGETEEEEEEHGEAEMQIA